jgi:hypothetical protein
MCVCVCVCVCVCANKGTHITRTFFPILALCRPRKISEYQLRTWSELRKSNLVVEE